MVRAFTAAMGIVLLISTQGFLGMCGLRCDLRELGQSTGRSTAAMCSMCPHPKYDHATRSNNRETDVRGTCCTQHCSFEYSISLQDRAQVEQGTTGWHSAVPGQVDNSIHAAVLGASFIPGSLPLQFSVPPLALNIRI